MSTRVYVETLPGGNTQFVKLKRSRSHHHHHDHHHYEHHHHHEHRHEPRCGKPTLCHKHQDCLHVPVDEWNGLVKSEQDLRCQVRELKSSLKKSEHENDRLRASEDKLTCRVRELCDENASLRQSLDSAVSLADKRGREVARLRDEVGRLERDNDCMRVRIRQLLKECRHSSVEPIAYLRRLVKDWKHKFECADRALEDRMNTIAEQREKIAEQRDRLALYERLLRRHNIVIC